MRTLTDYERGWLEAIIDGEGCLGFYKIRAKGYYGGVQWKPLLQIANTCDALICRVKGLLGGSVVHSFRNNPNAKPVTQLHVVDKVVLGDLLKAIQLISKDRQRTLLLEALSILKTGKNPQKGFGGTQKGLGLSEPRIQNRQRLEEIYQEMRSLNKRGTK